MTRKPGIPVSRSSTPEPFVHRREHGCNHWLCAAAARRRVIETCDRHVVGAEHLDKV